MILILRINLLASLQQENEIKFIFKIGIQNFFYFQIIKYSISKEELTLTTSIKIDFT